jgi:hypothetical protein
MTFPNSRDRREHRIFKQLLQMVPGFEQRIMDGTEADLSHVADLVRHSGDYDFSMHPLTRI